MINRRIVQSSNIIVPKMKLFTSIIFIGLVCTITVYAAPRPCDNCIIDGTDPGYSDPKPIGTYSFIGSLGIGIFPFGSAVYGSVEQPILI